MRLLRCVMALLLCMVLLASAALAEVITVYAGDYPVQEGGWYDSMEEVAVYLTLFETLPDNYLTKKQAQALGWDSRRGNLWDVAQGYSIGGDRFGNYEGQLPEKKGRRYTECDIDYNGGYRGAQRLIFSSDGLMYYTEDHYATFDEVRVEEGASEGEESGAGGLFDALMWWLAE